MERPISRRDFLDGVALSALASWAPGRTAGSSMGESGSYVGEWGEFADDYPPVRQGLRGDTADAMAVPHALRDQRFWRHAGPPQPTGERYDLVVVGAGISGVSAAYRWWSREPGARILVLDNHGDVGGRARRNEFRPAGRAKPLVGYGGPPHLPSTPVREAAELLAELGAESHTAPGGPGGPGGRTDARTGGSRYRELGMRAGVFCDRESFGADRLVVLRPGWIADLPMTHEHKAEFSHLFDDPPDWFPGLGEAEKRARLAGLGYSAFLREVCRASPEVIRFCHTMPVRDRALTSDLVSALDAWSMADRHSFPGLAGLGLRRAESGRTPPGGTRPGGGGEPAQHADARPDGEWTQLFPDGNHGLIRMMLRRMIPGAASGDSAGDVTLARFDYDRLDRPGNRVRVRLSSPVVLVRNDGPADAAASATVGYHDGEAVRAVRADAVVLACPHDAIPDLVTDLPPERRAALRQAVRAPVLFATAQLRDWRGWRAAGVDRVRFTGAYWSDVRLAPSLDAGTYRAPADPGEPILAHLVRPVVRPGAAPRAGADAGRRELAAVPYRHLELTVRDQLARLLGATGFDPARDIQGLTINRWAHGVPLGRSGGAERPSWRFGRIVVAGSDSVPGGRADAAIGAAFHAVDALRV